MESVPLWVRTGEHPVYANKTYIRRAFIDLCLSCDGPQLHIGHMPHLSQVQSTPTKNRCTALAGRRPGVFKSLGVTVSAVSGQGHDSFDLVEATNWRTTYMSTEQYFAMWLALTGKLCSHSYVSHGVTFTDPGMKSHGSLHHFTSHMNREVLNFYFSVCTDFRSSFR